MLKVIVENRLKYLKEPETELTRSSGSDVKNRQDEHNDDKGRENEPKEEKHMENEHKEERHRENEHKEEKFRENLYKIDKNTENEYIEERQSENKTPKENDFVEELSNKYAKACTGGDLFGCVTVKSKLDVSDDSDKRDCDKVSIFVKQKDNSQWTSKDYWLFDLARIEEVLTTVTDDFDYKSLGLEYLDSAEYVLEMIKKERET